ncbi:DUF4389 domain-containing protein [Modestobacter sp. SSW1-42]|uniref:DUF4389 domain-containing protein n=1 Tax=Modestobacter sp. SSW1-42 TaxID=596372 RepID=UPI00398713F4
MSGDDVPYPVRVDAALDAPLSRWLWLVKWLLLVPHLVVLAFLWAAFAVVSVVAFVAILATGRYPRALFDFTVGVLRWTWRVQYYGYAALGTDRYPPFTLADVPDYPARLDVVYPERLSRGLVLVKWWLLALPHYVVVAAFAGGGLWFGSRSAGEGGWSDGWAFGGLVSLLVVVAGVVLLVGKRYPPSLYDFVLGMDRWVLRVVAYAALMTDAYPPFRMDLGGTDPGSRPVPPVTGPTGGRTGTAPGTPPTADLAGTGTPASPGAWTGGRVVAVVAGSLLALTATGLLSGGGALLYADRTQRQDGGWLETPAATLSTDGYALVTDDVQLRGAGVDWVVDEVLGRVRLEVTADGSGPVFVGVAPTAEVSGLLDGVARTRLDALGARRGGWAWTGERGSGWRTDPGTTTELPGGPPASAPGDLDIWTASASGPGTQTLEWTPAEGDWTAVVMPVDRSAGLDAEVSVAATVPGLTWLAGGLLAGGAVLLATGALLIGLAVHRAGSRPVPPAAPGPQPGPQPGPTGPWSPASGDPRLSPSAGPR